MKFNIIVAIDQKNGIGFNNSIPWINDYSDLHFFKKITTECDSSSRQNVIIMGKNTCKSINYKSLPNRLNCVISKSLSINNNLTDNSSHVNISSDFLIFPNLDNCLQSLYDNHLEQINKIFVIGGEQLYKEAIVHPKCNRLYVNYIPKIYTCDTFFNEIDSTIYNKVSLETDDKEIQYMIFDKIKQINLQEYQYIDLVKRVLYNGITKDDRTNIGTSSIFGNQMRFSLENNSFPLLTTKRVFLRGIIEELLWFIKGCTDSNELSKKNVRIWDGNGSRDFLDSIGFSSREEGDLGPVYGFQWRFWGADYIDNKTDYSHKGIDQLLNLIDQIKTNPNSRRLILSAWNIADIPKMALPPCHVMCQFYVADNKISAQLYQRSGDIGLGVPFNIASYALLLKMVAYVTGYEPFELVYTLGDAHIYNSHIESMKEQIVRMPRDFPTLSILNEESIHSIHDFTINNFSVQNYKPHKNIKMEMAL